MIFTVILILRFVNFKFLSLFEIIEIITRLYRFCKTYEWLANFLTKLLNYEIFWQLLAAIKFSGLFLCTKCNTVKTSTVAKMFWRVFAPFFITFCIAVIT